MRLMVMIERTSTAKEKKKVTLFLVELVSWQVELLLLLLSSLVDCFSSCVRSFLQPKKTAKRLKSPA